MKLLMLLLILVLSPMKMARGKAMRLIRTPKEREILEALNEMIKEAVDEIEDVEEFGDESSDTERQNANQSAGNLETCEVTGSETRTREECEEVTEEECKTIQVTKSRAEIVTVCKTVVDLQGNCSVAYKKVPTEICLDKQEKRCAPDFYLVPETQFKEDCFTNIQSICEEQIKIQYPVLDNSTSPPPPPVKYNTPHPPQHYPTPPHKLSHKGTPPIHPYQPIFGPFQNIDLNREPHPTLEPYQLIGPFQNKKRHTRFPSGEDHERQKREVVFAEFFSQIKNEIERRELEEVLPKDISIEDLKSTLKNIPLRKPQVLLQSSHPQGSQGTPHHQLQVTSQNPPLVTTQELPAPPGCRTIATKICQRTPYLVTNKVPFETCKKVPGVECHLETKKVPELECEPGISQDCQDVERRVPFLDDVEECVEITFDDCIPIVEEIPIQVCTRTRTDETKVFIQKGAVMRKEGEKRRKKTRGKKKDKKENL